MVSLGFMSIAQIERRVKRKRILWQMQVVLLLTEIKVMLLVACLFAGWVNCALYGGCSCCHSGVRFHIRPLMNSIRQDEARQGKALQNMFLDTISQWKTILRYFGSKHHFIWIQRWSFRWRHSQHVYHCNRHFKIVRYSHLDIYEQPFSFF